MREKDLKEDLATMAYKAESDHEVQMARSDLYKIAKYSIKLHEMLKAVNEQQGIEGWVQSKITKAADYMGSVYHHLDYEMKFDEMTEAKKAKPDYIDIDGDGDKKEPMKKAVKDKKNKKTTEEAKPVDDDDPRYADDENLPKNKKKKKESLTLDSIYKNRLQEQLESKLSEKSSKETKCPDCNKPSYKTLPEEKQKGVDGKVCWKGYKRMGTKKKGGKTVDNCVKM